MRRAGWSKPLRWLVSGVTSLALSAWGAAGESAPEPLDAVAWQQIRAEIGRTICAVEVEHRGQAYTAYRTGDREACTGESPGSEIARAVDTAFERAAGILTSIDAAETGYASREDEPLGKASARLRAAYLAHRPFVDPLLRRLPQALAEEGLHCRDCPEPKPVETRRTDWATMRPYITAHVWPDPVRTPVDEEGEPTGRPRVTFHVCTGINGVSELDDPDPLLARAGYLAVRANHEILSRASGYMLDLSRSEAFTGLGDDEARTAFLRRELAARLGADPVVRDAACARLTELAPDLGLVVEDCAAAPGPR